MNFLNSKIGGLVSVFFAYMVLAGTAINNAADNVTHLIIAVVALVAFIFIAVQKEDQNK